MSLTPAVHRDVAVVLTKTRPVQHRIHFGRRVARDLIGHCLERALHAPSGANRQDGRYIAVGDSGQCATLAEIHQASLRAHYGLRTWPSRAGRRLPPPVFEPVHFLARQLERVLVLVVPARAAIAPSQRAGRASFRGPILPAAWSLMLADRSRGLVSSYAARGLDREEEPAEVLGLPDPEVTQPGLIADGHPDAQSFKPACRRPVEEVVRWNRYE